MWETMRSGNNLPNMSLSPLKFSWSMIQILFNGTWSCLVVALRSGSWVFVAVVIIVTGSKRTAIYQVSVAWSLPVNVLVVVENWTQSGPSLRQSVLQVALSLTTTGASIRSGLLHLVTAFAWSLLELLFPGSQGLTELRIIRTSGLQLLDVPISTSGLSTIVHKRRNILEHYSTI